MLNLGEDAGLLPEALDPLPCEILLVKQLGSHHVTFTANELPVRLSMQWYTVAKEPRPNTRTTRIPISLSMSLSIIRLFYNQNNQLLVSATKFQNGFSSLSVPLKIDN
jgi:hypothetical protein